MIIVYKQHTNCALLPVNFTPQTQKNQHNLHNSCRIHAVCTFTQAFYTTVTVGGGDGTVSHSAWECVTDRTHTNREDPFGRCSSMAIRCLHATLDKAMTYQELKE